MEDYDRDKMYAVDGYQLNDILRMASELNNGMRLDPDRRRDIAQTIQVKLDGLCELPEEMYKSG